MPNNKQWYDLVAQTARKKGFAESDIPIIQSLVKQESGWNPNARSSKGALGLMQLMPATAKGLGVTNPLDPVQNINGGITYLKQQYDRFGGNMDLALAAYNAGPNAPAIKQGRIPNYPETQNFVRNIKKMAGNQTGQFANSQGFTGTTPATQDVGNLIDLAKQAAPAPQTQGFVGSLNTKSLVAPNKSTDKALLNAGKIAEQGYKTNEFTQVPMENRVDVLGRVGKSFGSGGALPQADPSVVNNLIGDSINQRLVVDPTATQGENFNAVAKQSGDIRRGVGKGAAIGGLLGTILLPGIGTAVGAGLGAGIGAFKGRGNVLQRVANQTELLRKEGLNAQTLGNQVQLGADRINRLVSVASNTGFQGGPELLQSLQKAYETGNPQTIAQATQAVGQTLAPHIKNYAMHLTDLLTTAHNRGDRKAAEAYSVQLGQLNALRPQDLTITSAQNNQALLSNNRGNTMAGLIQSITPLPIAQEGTRATLGAARINQATSFGVTDRTNAGNLQVTQAQGKNTVDALKQGQLDPEKLAVSKSIAIKNEAEQFSNEALKQEYVKNQLTKAVQETFDSGNYSGIPVFFKEAATQTQKEFMRNVLKARIAQTITSTGKTASTDIVNYLAGLAERGDIKNKQDIFDAFNSYNSDGLPAIKATSFLPPKQ